MPLIFNPSQESWLKGYKCICASNVPRTCTGEWLACFSVESNEPKTVHSLGNIIKDLFVFVWLLRVIMFFFHEVKVEFGSKGEIFIFFRDKLGKAIIRNFLDFYKPKIRKGTPLPLPSAKAAGYSKNDLYPITFI